jgi:hypothetical protein
MRKMIKIPIYFGELVIEQHASLKHVEMKYGLRDTHGMEAVAFRWPHPNGYHRYVAAFTHGVPLSVIVHECVHIVNMLFDDVGVKLDVRNDESQAYVTGWVAEQCFKYLKINK